jgi:hypothetical protein
MGGTCSVLLTFLSLMLHLVKVKVMFTLEQTTKDQKREWRYSSTLSLTSALEEGGW